MSAPRKDRDRAAQTVPLPPAGLPLRTCWCSAVYLDNDGGHDSHDVVFGHRPSERQP